MSAQATAKYISDTGFNSLLAVFSSRGKVFMPQAVTGQDGTTHFHYEPLKEGGSFEHAGFRPVQPLKSYLFQSRIKVADYPAGGDEIPLDESTVYIIGAAACDVISLKSLDVIFLQDEFTDVFYRARRENTIIVSADCSEPRESCFCTLQGNTPYASSGFDLNLTAVDGGFLLEAGSDAGESILTDFADHFSDPGQNMFDDQDRQRQEAEIKVAEINRGYELSKSKHDLLGELRESDHWNEHVNTCVECGACLFSCPTCHCFMLYDTQEGEGAFKRFKKWDACIYGGYSRMSGGGSPRLGLMERFRHRYLHKLEYYPDNFGFEACTGCGRCIEGCMGRIDMRKVMSALDLVIADSGGDA